MIFRSEAAFKEAMSQDKPYVIDTIIDIDEMVLPMIPPGGSIENIVLTQPKEDK